MLISIFHNKYSALRQRTFRFLYLLESLFAYTQGKGYGATSIKKEIALIENFITVPPRLAIDIGGNIGDYTSELRRWHPEMEVHVFEPSTTNISKLTKRFNTDAKIIIQPFAVSDSVGSAILFSNYPGSGLGSLVQRNLDHANVKFNITEPVKLIRFENYWEDILKCRQIDILKLDIEGYELNALRGFGRALNNIKIIQFEFGGCNIDSRSFFRDFWYFFLTEGFELYRMTPFGLQHIHRYVERDECFKTTNFIAVNLNTVT